MELQLWVMSGLSGALIMVVWWSTKRWIIRIDSKFEELNKNLHNMIREQVQQSGKITSIDNRVTTNEKRINDHAERLRAVEYKQASCKHNEG